MQFLIDECVGSTMSDWLKSEGFATFSVFDQLRGASDNEILEKCFSDNYILITADKDFGDMVFREQKQHKGIVLIRCNPNNFK